MIDRLNTALVDRYQVLEQVGEGGMATVFLADDLKHERKVALKVLKPELAAVVGAERFLAEIKTTANLQHPHILPLYDSGEALSFLYYVMPYVQGATLSERLEAEKQLSVDEAVGSGGRERLTETGLSLGTPYYMSPEQATGDQQVGPKSDIYSLGSVLYEMLTGDPPYTGSTAQAVLGRILTETPRPPTAIRAAVPLNVEAAVLKALEQLPADRFRTATEFGKALADEAFRYGVTDEEAAGGPGPWKRVALALGLSTVLATAGLAALMLQSDPSQPVARYAVGLPNSQHVSEGFGSNVTISPDGSAIVYVGPAEDGFGQQLWVRQRDQLLPAAVASTEDAFSPVFSPDGGRVAFCVGGALRISSLGGEQPREILNEAQRVRESGLTWSDDGHLYYSTDTEIWRIPDTGGDPEIAVPLDPDQSDMMQRWPDALPDGRGILFTIADAGPSRNQEAWTIAVFDAESGEQRTVLNGVFARYARSGHIVYVSPDGTLLAAPFDLGSLEVTGDPVTLAGTVRVGLDGIHLDVSDEGTLVYLAGRSEERVRPVWVSRDGLAQVIDPDWSGRMYFPSLSPDGSRAAVDMLTGSNDLWIKQLDTGPQLRLTRHESGGARAAWTPDGNAVSFFSVRGGNEDVWTKRADGSGPAELTFDGVESIHEVFWSPDGEWLVYRTPAGEGIYAVRPEAEEEPVTIVETDAREFSPTLSPDGRFIAFMSNETGRYEIYVVPFPNAADARWAVSTGGGRNPRWSPAGDEIFFIDATDTVVSVPVESELGAPWCLSLRAPGADPSLESSTRLLYDGVA